MIVSKLNSVDINFEDEIKALILMSSLPESWDTVVAAISSSRGSEKLKFDEICDVVLSESIRKREVGDSSGSALSVDRGKFLKISNVTCWNCGEKGHFRTNCTNTKNKQNQKFGDDNDSINSAEDIGDVRILRVNSWLNHGFWIQVHLSIRLQAKSCSNWENC